MLYEHLLLRQSLPGFGEKMSLEEKLDEACHRREVPGIVLAANGPGQFSYHKSFGKRSMRGERGYEPFDIDAVLSLASCTKLLTTVAALQCVDRGLIALDEDVTGILSEFKNIEILTGFDDRTQAPVLVKSKNKLTLRRLLTHTSGISHPCWNHLLYEYLSTQGRPISSVSGNVGKIERLLFYPLVFEPGTSWEYGAGLDWAGKLVERLNDGMSLQEYMDLNIFRPLDMSSATFRLSERPELREKVPRMMMRQGLNHPIYGTAMYHSGRLVPVEDEGLSSVTGTASHGKIEELPDDHPDSMSQYKEETDDFGGSGAYCSASDFAKLLHVLCLPPSKTTPPTGFGNSHSTTGVDILSTSMVREMFTPQLSAASRVQLQSFFTVAEISNIFGHGLPFANMHMDMASGEPLPPLDFGLGGLLVVDDVPGFTSSSLDAAGLPGYFDQDAVRPTRRRKRGSMFWSGFPNVYWWMDPASGVSGFYGSQLLPQGDQRSLEWFAQWEELIYEQVAQTAH